jgi:hypothetical protein
MRFESSVTSLSWIPTEAMSGPLRIPVDLGIGHYDPPPPERVDDLEALRSTDRFRFANRLAAYIEVVDGEVVAAGYQGRGLIGATTLRLGPRSLTIPAVSYPDLQAEPQVSAAGVRFVQTAGGRTGAPLPRRIARPPFLQVTAPTAWTTLALTIALDGCSSFELLGASSFPRHWIYGDDGHLSLKTGVIDFSQWAAEATHDRSPWHDQDQAVPVSEVESPTERDLSVAMMGGRKPELRRYPAGETILRQGEAGSEVMLVLDGMVEISVDDRVVAEAGPGAMLGERAALENAVRTATVVATTPVRVAITHPDGLDPEALATVARLHRREEAAIDR